MNENKCDRIGLTRNKIREELRELSEILDKNPEDIVLSQCFYNRPGKFIAAVIVSDNRPYLFFSNSTHQVLYLFLFVSEKIIHLFSHFPTVLTN